MPDTLPPRRGNFEATTEEPPERKPWGSCKMFEYTGAGDGARLMMLVLHDDGTARMRLGSGAETC
jgi:hypothetical protein